MLIINGVPQADSKDARLFINGEAQVNLWGLLLATGQTTKYVTGDDGDLELGLAKAYAIYTTGQYSGTTNVDLIHLTATDIAFVAATKKITSVAAALAMFKTGQTIVITGSASNNGTYTIATGNVAAEIVTTEALTDEGAGASVSIAKREAHSNNCVLDLNTGLMWSRYVAGVMGAAGDGTMPWSVVPYNIFAYKDAAIVAALGGHIDWRVPNLFESFSLMNVITKLPDATAFPTAWGEAWTSSSPYLANPEYAERMKWGTYPESIITLKTDAYYCALVRG